jgi:hypothetical protein
MVIVGDIFCNCKTKKQKHLYFMKIRCLDCDSSPVFSGNWSIGGELYCSGLSVCLSVGWSQAVPLVVGLLNIHSNSPGPSNSTLDLEAIFPLFFSSSIVPL